MALYFTMSIVSWLALILAQLLLLTDDDASSLFLRLVCAAEGEMAEVGGGSCSPTAWRRADAVAESPPNKTDAALSGSTPSGVIEERTAIAAAERSAAREEPAAVAGPFAGGSASAAGVVAGSFCGDFGAPERGRPRAAGLR